MRDMSTAVVRIHLPEGFVIGADGLSSGGSTTIQKIFEMSCPSGPCGVGVSGQGEAEFSTNGHQPLRINFGEECRRVTQLMAQRSPKSFRQLVEIFSDIVIQNIEEQIYAGRATGVVSDEDFLEWRNLKGCTRLHFVGFFDRDPWMSTVTIEQGENGLNREIDVKELNPAKVSHVFFGSDAVRDRLRLLITDPAFDEFRNEGFRKVWEANDPTLIDGFEAVKSYINACASLQARLIDSYCNSIGGHTHIATITPSDGFQWLIPPIL